MSEYRASASDQPLLIAAFNGRIFGLDPASGSIVWEFELPEGRFPVHIAVADDRVFAAALDKLHCLDAKTGARQWDTALAFQGVSEVRVMGHALLVVSNGELECFSLTGEALWQNGFVGKGWGVISLGGPLVQPLSGPPASNR
ncbi:MAG: PQQ-binding-like beta-propeller repeat protein [Myxococcales bacterium]|nr:PQQ-binding-like beta-propeller repeat protein [Myxococcales bacterium]